MANREPGVFRRSKGGDVKRIGKPTAPQRYGAHSEHPSKVKSEEKPGKPTTGATDKAADSSTGKEKGNADA